MAQAIYDSHPLQEYLEESDFQSLSFPGAYPHSRDDDDDYAFSDIDFSWLPPIVLASLQNVLKAYLAVRGAFPSPLSELAERFKYDLISSTLLTSAVPATPLLSHLRPRPSSPASPLPGQLLSSQHDAPEKTEEELKLFSSSFAFIGIAAALSHYRLFALVAFLVSYSSMRSYETPASAKNIHQTQIHKALQDLIDAGTVWDASVNECMAALDREERGSIHSSASASSAASNPSSLRLALHSTLLTTHSQCDNVRPLLAALASPSELSQLAEMYAPPSPAKQSFSLLSPQLPRRPFSLSESAVYPPSNSTHSFSSDKRQTWNGSYMTLAGFNSRSPPVARKKKNWRRSDVSSLINTPNSQFQDHTSSSQPPVPPISSLREYDDSGWQDNNDDSSPVDFQSDNFGTAALHVRRKRRSRGSVALAFPPSRSAPSLRSPHRSPMSSSKFTAFQPSKHPLSVSALHHSLDGAVAARRYACAHLLALRFVEDAEDESYWENAKSVMSLLTTTLEDASARLSQALVESEQQQESMAQPSPLPSPISSVDLGSDPFLSSISGPRVTAASSTSSTSKPQLSLPLLPQSFAPMPSASTRFGGHVDTITCALGEASSHLRSLVSILQDAAVEQGRERSSFERAALDDLENLRRELGFALRACERGKTVLIDHLECRIRRSSTEYGPPGSESEEEARIADQGRSSGSPADLKENQECSPVTPDEGSPILPSLNNLLARTTDSEFEAIASLGEGTDDVTQHLLDSASARHLPPVGVEQVFEAEPVPVAPYTGERSKLSREERIKLQKAKRASMQSRMPTPFGSSTKASRYAAIGLGPGMDVVDELKDVIWKVGENRRRLKEAAISTLETILDDNNDSLS